jgi:Fic family protein
MKSFEPGFIEKQPISQNLLRTIRLIGEGKGKQELFKKQAPQVLETLQKVSIIQSTESSNRIEGIEAPLSRIRQLIDQKTTPQNRSEQEIAGYRDVLNTIHSNWEGMAFTIGLVRQLHRDLYRFLPSEGGKWKMADNTIEETRPDGTKVVRFRPVPAFQTPDAMRDLHDRFKPLWELGEIEPLLLISAYVLDFLCIHPFTDGNGRMARLLTLLLLYKTGFEVGRYISLEMIVEETRESYYDALAKSSRKWHQGKHSLVPWSEYLLGVVVLGAYREFENRAGMITTARGAKRQMVFDTVGRLPLRFQYSDVERSCPSVSRPTINRALAELRDQGKIRCIKSGRDATWEKT